MEDNAAKKHLQQYTAERLPALTPGTFDGNPDIPYFTIDKRLQQLKQLPYESKN